MDLLKNTLRLWAMRREFRAVLAELGSLSNHELAELGLARGDIARVAREEAKWRILGPASSRPEALAAAWRRSAPVLGRYRDRQVAPAAAA